MRQNELIEGDNTAIKDARLKGEIMALRSLINLPEDLYSVELKPENTKIGTEVD